MDIIPEITSLLIKEIPEVKLHIVIRKEAQNPLYLELMDKVHRMNLDEAVFIDNTFYDGEESQSHKLLGSHPCPVKI